MSLTPGTRLGPYEIVSLLGAGGMGEVYHARDTRLDRDVAIKALPAGFAEDPERLGRFEREAKLLASLSHPNIAGILGLEEVGGARHLVLEFVEGETLGARLARGALPIDETIEIAKQIAAGVEAAHERGVVHRDLKPGNVMLTASGTVKVLDFGLAKAAGADSTGSDPRVTVSPTVTSMGTRAGMILGTAAYMSPEQARGRVVDKRTDIWSFGCVVYECLAGRPLFRGDTASDLIAKILEREPEWDALPAGTPARLRELLHRCLRKDARERLRDIGDARLELGAVAERSSIASGEVAPAPLRRPWIWPAVAVLATALGVAAGYRLSSPAKTDAPVRRFTIPVPQFKAQFGNHPRISPDGRRILFASGQGLWIRDLQRFESVSIPGTDGAWDPFWSPDGLQLGFMKDGKLWITAPAGSNARLICSLPEPGTNGATWGRGGRIVFAVFRRGLYEVSAKGGEPRLVIAPAEAEVDFHLPDRLGDGERIVAVAHAKSGPNPIVVIDPRDGTRKDLARIEGVESAVYAPGHLLLTVGEGRQQILGVAFAESKLAITGEPFPVALNGQYPSVSRDGVMTYFLGAAGTQYELVWLRHDGQVERAVGQPLHGLGAPAISPDGASVALVAFEKGNADIWIQDLVRGTRRPFAATPKEEMFPQWSGDGRSLVYGEYSSGVEPDLMEGPVDGAGAPRSLGVTGWWPNVTPDGKVLVFDRDLSGQQVLWRLEIGAGEPIRLTRSSTANEDRPALSPDGRWLAYSSDAAGGVEIFLSRFPSMTQTQQVSLSRGESPFWSPSGRSLYFWENGTLMEASIPAGEPLRLTEPKRLFNAGEAGIGLGAEGNDRPPVAAAADGRFLAVRRAAGDPYGGVLVVENWVQEFRER